jgi:hypothetical protein
MFARGGSRRHDRAAHGPAFQNYVRFNGRIATRIQNFARTNGSNLSHIGPRNAVPQPVIQLGTAIHGKSFSGGALNRAQKLLHCVDILFLKKRKKRSSSVGILANPRGGGLRGRSHRPYAAGSQKAGCLC